MTLDPKDHGNGAFVGVSHGLGSGKEFVDGIGSARDGRCKTVDESVSRTFTHRPAFTQPSPFVKVFLVTNCSQFIHVFPMGNPRIRSATG